MEDTIKVREDIINMYNYGLDNAQIATKLGNMYADLRNRVFAMKLIRQTLNGGF